MTVVEFGDVICEIVENKMIMLMNALPKCNYIIIKIKIKILLWTVKFDITERPCRVVSNFWALVTATCKGWIIAGAI